MQYPSRENYDNMNPELPRVVALGLVEFTGEYYHWKLDEYRTVTEFYSAELETTENHTV